MKETIINATAVEVYRTKLTDEEVEILRKAARKGSTLDTAIPSNADAEWFDTALGAVCKELAKYQIGSEILFPVLGKLMLVAKENPNVWKPKYKTYEGLLDDVETKYGVSRSTCFEARKLVERWEKIVPLDAWKAIGRVKMNLITKAIPRGDEGKGTARKLINMAQSSTADEVADWIDENLHISPAEHIGAMFKMPCNKKQQKIFEKWFEDINVQATCESNKWADILERMIEYCSGEFLQEQEKGRRVAEGAA